MEDDLSVVLASNRGPISFVSSHGGYDITRGAGGLAGALDPVARRLGDGAVWIAATTSSTDREALNAGACDGISEKLGYELYLLDFQDDVYSGYYDIVSNRMLWFANHCLWDEFELEGFGERETMAWERSYVPVNRAFANAVLEVANHDSMVLFQDYHLAIAPQLVRRARPRQTIFHFTHSSFCAEGLAPLPEAIARGVVEGILGADLVGFHTSGWAQEFFRACRRFGFAVDRDTGTVLHGDRSVWVRAYPIPVDVRDLRQRAGGRDATSWKQRFEADTADAQVIVRADRTEPSKNIVRGFEAFGLLLDRRDDLEGRVRFIACLYPSRQSMPEYRKYQEEIVAAAEDVNARHPGSIEMFLEDDYDRTLGALSLYDVLLVNSLMDGMNLVSKEGPAINRRDGAIVLTSTAGSYEQLRGNVVEVSDPRDVEETAKALEIALSLDSEERAGRAARLRTIVEQKTPADWIRTQLRDLSEIKAGGAPLTPAPG